MMKKAWILLFLLVSLCGWSQGLVPVEEKGKWGYQNPAKEWVVNPQYVEARSFVEGFAAVNKNGKWGFIDGTGNVLVKPQYSFVHDFSEGMAAVLSEKELPGTTLADNMQFKWGFVNTAGKLVVPFQFRNVFPFKDDRALVALWGMKNKELFMIDKNGKGSSPRFERKDVVNGMLRLANSRDDGDSVYCYTQLNGAPITDWYLHNFYFQDFPVTVQLPSNATEQSVPSDAFSGKAKHPLFAMMNSGGEIFSKWYDVIEPFEGGYAAVKSHHKWGFVNGDYEEVVLPTYGDMGHLGEGYYSMQLGLEEGVLVGPDCKELCKLGSYFEVYDADAFLANDNLYIDGKPTIVEALVDKSGKQLSGWYNLIDKKRNGIARVEEIRLEKKGDAVGFGLWYNYIVDSTGEVLSDWRSDAEISWEGGSRKDRDSIWNHLYSKNFEGLLNEDFFKTVFVKNLDFDKSKRTLNFKGGAFQEGMCLVSQPVKEIEASIGNLKYKIEDIKYGYIDWYGDLVIPCRYIQAGGFSDRMAIVGNGKLYGAIDDKGVQRIPYMYELMGNYMDGLAPVYKEGKWGYLDKQNKMRISPEYDDAKMFMYGMAAVKKNGKWGAVDVYGREVLPFEYQKAPEAISMKKAKVLKRGYGYKEVLIGKP